MGYYFIQYSGFNCAFVFLCVEWPRCDEIGKGRRRGNLLPSHHPAQPDGHDQDTGASARTFSILPPHPKPCPHAPSWSNATRVYTSASTIPLFPSCLEMALMRKTALSLFKSNILTTFSTFSKWNRFTCKFSFFPKVVFSAWDPAYPVQLLRNKTV